MSEMPSRDLPKVVLYGCRHGPCSDCVTHASLHTACHGLLLPPTFWPQARTAQGTYRHKLPHSFGFDEPYSSNAATIRSAFCTNGLVSKLPVARAKRNSRAHHSATSSAYFRSSVLPVICMIVPHLNWIMSVAPGSAALRRS